ncbi:MAG TPA: CopG family transcriptional regulator [Candidatus Altiarchaeales archaeon]|nr:CopG family transcriptional regulator [Candidatus Altiarchaeales archaeon]
MSEKNIELPKDLYEWIENRLPETEFKTVDEYVSYVVSEVRKNIEGDSGGEEALSKADEEKVKDRLRALGYLD